MPPVLLVCEEAHRYVPVDERIGFAATTRAITRIAKEGRKYGISLALVSQRPSDLAVTALSQSAREMLDVLPSLRTQEAIISGRAVSMPMRIRFDDLSADRRPHSESPKFSAAWQEDRADPAHLEEVLRRWRQQSRNAPLLG
jgi:DNA helicase HerA-like ATPase